MTITEARCRRCHRPLRDARSVAIGLGPTCAKAAQVDAAGYTGEQIADARELVELGGVVRLRGRGRRRVYEVLGRHGHYRTAITGQCSCERSARRGQRCYHAAAVTLYAATAPTRRAPIALPAA